MLPSRDLLRFVDGSEFRITQSAAHTNSEYLLEGVFEVFVRDAWRTVRAGESASAPAGEVHTAAESALMEAGKIRSYSSPRAALHYAVLLDRYRHCMVMASPLLRALISALAPLARRLGFGRI